MMLKACLNGGVTRRQHPAVPITPAELARDAARCRAAGAAAVHIHPCDTQGIETFAAPDIAAAISAVREACPGLPIGVSTGAWITPGPLTSAGRPTSAGPPTSAGRPTSTGPPTNSGIDPRVHAIRSWTVLPDFASVNVHEEGAEAVARALFERGIGVEAGVWTVDAATAYLHWRVPVVRVLVECMAPDIDQALSDARLIVATLQQKAPPLLLHAEGPAVWAVIREAVRRRLDTRVGLEDTLVLPDGSPTPDNVALVEAAITLGAR
jgi:uncharacterized protein (DUF849 family)